MPEQKDRTLFLVRNDQGAEAALYLPASGLFTFSIKNVYRSAYNLEAKLYRLEVPVDTWATIFCQIAIVKGESTLRIVVDKKEIRRRTIPAALALGVGEKWSPQLGGGGTFLLQEIGLITSSITNGDIGKLVDNQNQFYNR